MKIPIPILVINRGLSVLQLSPLQLILKLHQTLIPAYFYADKVAQLCTGIHKKNIYVIYVKLHEVEKEGGRETIEFSSSLICPRIIIMTVD